MRCGIHFVHGQIDFRNFLLIAPDMRQISPLIFSTIGALSRISCENTAGAFRILHAGGNLQFSCL